VAVLEVGMGGRFDATNVVTPLVSVITSLSLDHMNLLGNSIEQIAFEKAGIIKRHVPVVSAPQVPEAMDVIRRVARIRGSRLVPTPTEEREIPLLGAHQQVNANVAMAALQVANERGLRVSDEAIRHGLATVQWVGRLEVLSREPLVVVDGAHNGDSAQKLAKALREVFHLDKWTLIIGVSADKDIAAILDGLLPIAEHVIMTRASNTRAASVQTLKAQIANRSYKVTSATNVSEALEIALQDQAPIIITGSLFTVADAREAWFQRSGLPLEKDE
jgi:dihydrofolate synthase/folylpolyglutamate synthase